MIRGCVTDSFKMSVSYFHKDHSARFAGIDFIREIEKKKVKKSLVVVNGVSPTKKVTSGTEDKDEDSFDLTQVNDFTQEELKAEMSLYEERGELKAEQVCAAYHGGPLDYPKVFFTCGDS